MRTLQIDQAGYAFSRGSTWISYSDLEMGVIVNNAILEVWAVIALILFCDIIVYLLKKYCEWAHRFPIEIHIRGRTGMCRSHPYDEECTATPYPLQSKLSETDHEVLY